MRKKNLKENKIKSRERKIRKMDYKEPRKIIVRMMMKMNQFMRMKTILIHQ